MGTRGVIPADSANSTPSTYYKFWWAMFEGAGDAGDPVIDHKCDHTSATCSDVNGLIGSANDSAWQGTHDGYIYAKDTIANGAAAILPTASAGHLNTAVPACWLFAFIVKTGDANANIMMGCSNAPGTNDGFRLTDQADGNFGIVFGDASGNSVTYNTAAIPGGDAAQTYHVTFAVSCDTRKLHLYIDGSPIYTDEDFPAGMSDWSIADHVDAQRLAWGAQNGGGAAYNVAFRDIQHLYLPSTPTNIGDIAKKLAGRPYILLKDSDISL